MVKSSLLQKMEPDTATYVTAAEDGPKLSRHNVYYLKNSKRLRQKAQERRDRDKRRFETLPQAEQEEIKDRPAILTRVAPPTQSASKGRYRTGEKSLRRRGESGNNL
ncbi:hypothetical protein BJ912DRAFT_923316 [Pholiota molesta]|nr:hypothetical protein BJ912DRAFT_923316 [Pholiota molesta]